MKKTQILILTLIFSALGSSLTYSQILNSSFENWNSGLPDNWSASIIPGLLNTVTQTSDSHDGSSAVKLEIIDYQGFPFPALLQNQNPDLSNFGHAVSVRYSKIKGYFKLDLRGAAQFVINLAMYDESMQPIGGGILTTSNSSANWSQIEVPIEYFDEKVPSFIHLAFAIFDSTDNDPNAIGSSVIIDHIIADAATGVKDNDNAPLIYSLNQNYPNPFNPTTLIRYSIANNVNNELQEVRLVVFDAIGREIATLVNETQQPGNYEVNFDASRLTSGAYFYRIQTGEFVETKKMILLR